MQTNIDERTGKSKIILGLFSGTGSWERPYLEAGYDVRHVTLPETDIRHYSPPDNVYGILAGVPCTDFASSGARWFADKDSDGRTIESTQLLSICLMIIARTAPVFWAIENPVGRINRWLGRPDFAFDPCDFGDPYTKRTHLWGKFNAPEKSPVEPTEGSRMWAKYGGKSERTKMLRAITPPGFAQAFFRANR